MKIHHLTVDQALASLHSRREGLSAAEAARRLLEYGENRIERLARPPLWRLLLKEFSHLFALILWLAAGLAFLSEWRDPGQGMAALGWAILAVILINGLFSFWQEYRAEQVLASLEALLPRMVAVLRDGVRQPLPAVQVVPGDILLLQEGDDVPADCRVIEAWGVRVNLAAVTGESLPKARTAEPSQAEDLLQARNVLLAGTDVLAGEARAVAFATGRHSEFGKIARLSQHGDVRASPLYREIARLSRLVAVLAVALGGGFFLLGTLLGQPVWASFVFAIGIMVANVPEGLLPTVTLALSMAARRMARRHALVRHLPAVETLGGASVILSDKTGTLTLNRMAVRRLWLGEGEIAPESLAERSEGGFALDIAVHCHTLKWEAAQRRYQGDPMEAALLRLDEGRRRWPKLDELPFDAERRRMSTLHAAPDGRRLFCKGALETVLPLCSRIQDGVATRPLDEAARSAALAAETNLAERGLRVLALAWRPVVAEEAREDWEQGLILVGLVGLADPFRPEVPEAIRRCFAAGIRVIMVTGDHPRTALAVARQIGLVQDHQELAGEPRVMTGEELRRLSPTQLQLALDRPELVFARLSADQKLILVRALQAKGQVVAVTGDGVNDAPALRAADIGVAMGRGGTEVAREAADLVLLDDNFSSIVAAIEEGRAVYQNIRKFLTYILTSNIPELVPYLAFVLFRIPLPLTVIQILAVDLGTDMLPALALGAEPPHPGLMREPPRPRGQHLLTSGLLLRAYLFLGVLEAVAAMATFFFVLDGGGWKYGQALAIGAPLTLQATTATLATIIVMQMVNVFLCRDPLRSAFSGGFAANPLIFLGLVVEFGLILGIAYTPWGNQLFGSAPIGWEVWLFALPFALAMLALEEGRKAFLRRRE
ncbi:MAG: ATPase [Hydrogenophilales bacterium CG_4_9_14_3_um_filter_63_34]|nr:MAG: ATPase [Hydrogenophilales bacterium CG_4_10_14_3_um_filter_63_21]PJB05942.1 MAG: ATPase [Hydrogenophilales bacterium CG_4_9_14_3_um_filter_63_34]